ncbi:hypothetical protein OSCI_90018 [Kamptonema sp. PCC 6506]|nr:hypothetical protein OSCI_90018 [Kamptonema sp. PCC 6506]
MPILASGYELLSEPLLPEPPKSRRYKVLPNLWRKTVAKRTVSRHQTHWQRGFW